MEIVQLYHETVIFFQDKEFQNIREMKGLKQKDRRILHHSLFLRKADLDGEYKI